MENIPKIKGGKIYIGTPCYGGQCFNTYVRSLLQTVQYFKERDLSISLEIRFLTNESLITRGRNLIVAQCLADKEATHLLFIDADVSWHPSTIEKLLNANVDIVGAIFDQKTLEVISNLEDNEICTQFHPATGTKCARCWNFMPEVGSYGIWQNVCKRCVDALKEMKIAPPVETV